MTQGSLVFHGDSITRGFGVPVGSDYPAQTISILGIEKYSWLNYGVDGQTMLQMIANAPALVDPQFAAGYRYKLTAFAGTNDIALSGVTGTVAYNRNVTYGTARKGVGWKLILIDMLPRNQSGFEAERTTFNGLLAADFPTNVSSIFYTGGAYADVLIRISLDTDMGQAGDELDLTWYSDGIHPTAAGDAKIAAYVAAAQALIP